MRASGLRRLFDWAYRLIVGSEASPRSRSFFASLGYLLGADVIVTLVSFAVSGLVIRALGPTEFGRANLVVSVAQFFTILLLLGLTSASARSLAATPTPGPVIGSALTLLGVLVLAWLPLLYLARGPLSRLFGVDGALYAWAVVYAAGLAVFYLAQSMLTGLQEFRRVGRLNVASTVMMVAVMGGALLSSASLGYAEYLEMNLVRWLGFAALALAFLLPRLQRPSLAWTRALLGFGGWHTLATFANFFLLATIDNLMLNALQGPAIVGLYSAYYAAFNLFTSRFLKIIADVLLPAATAHEARHLLARKVIRTYLTAGWLFIPAMAVFSRVLFILYGKAYVFEWDIAWLMGVSIFVYGALAIMGEMMAAAGVRGMRFSALASVAGGAVHVAANLVLIPPYGVRGTIGATLIASSVGCLLRYAMLRGPLRPRDP